MDYDIAVVGNGVAGIVSALRCTKYGFQVLLCVKNTPSTHALQSVHPSVPNSLADIGIDASIYQHCLTPSDSRIYWHKTEADTSEREPTFLLDRIAFDTALLQAAQDSNIHLVSDPKGFTWSNQDEGWKLSAKTTAQDYSAGYLINASGQIHGNSQTLLRQGGKTLVLRAQWQHAPQAGHSACTYIDSTPDCWFWGATLSGKSNLNIFLDPKPFKKANREGKGLEHLFKQLYNHYRWQGEMPKPEEVALDIMNATPYVSTDPISPKMVLVGGAAIRIDPLSSQGIHIAIATAVQAAVAVNTLIHSPENQADAIAFYRQRVRKRSDDHALFQSQAYRDAEANYKTPFWAERIQKDKLAAQDSAVQPFPSDHAINYYRRYSLHKDAKFGNTAVMGKDFIKSVPSLNHPRLSEPSFIADLKTIRQVLKQLSAIPLVMVLNHPLHKQYRNELEPLLSYWISCGVLEVVPA